MTYKDYLSMREQLDDMKPAEKNNFLITSLKNEPGKTALNIALKFEYAYIYYEKGNFNKARKILEPIITNYSAYDYCRELINVYLLAGAISQEDDDLDLSRYYYVTALNIAKRHKEKSIYVMCYNNISITYFSESKYENGLKYLRLGEKYIGCASEYMCALLYLNYTVAYISENKIDEALIAYNKSVNDYQGNRFPIKCDLLCCAVQIYSMLGDKEKFEEYKGLLLADLKNCSTVYAIGACESICNIALEQKDYALVEKIFSYGESFINSNPDEIKVALKLYEYKYKYAKENNNLDGMLEALEKRNTYFDLLLDKLDKKNTKEISQQLRINTLKRLNAEKKKENEMLMEISFKDSLTGVYNRHAFNMLFKGTANMRKAQSIAYAIIDLDDFKKINDNYSHLEGDDVLRNVGKVLLKYEDKNVKAYRYGGDEFVVLLGNLEYKNVISIVQNIQNELNRIRYNDNKKTASCTIGLAEMQSPVDLRILMEMADNRLYKAKEHKGSIVYED